MSFIRTHDRVIMADATFIGRRCVIDPKCCGRPVYIVCPEPTNEVEFSDVLYWTYSGLSGDCNNQTTFTPATGITFASGFSNQTYRLRYQYPTAQEMNNCGFGGFVGITYWGLDGMNCFPNWRNSGFNMFGKYVRTEIFTVDTDPQLTQLQLDLFIALFIDVSCACFQVDRAPPGMRLLPFCPFFIRTFVDGVPWGDNAGWFAMHQQGIPGFPFFPYIEAQPPIAPGGDNTYHCLNEGPFDNLPIFTEYSTPTSGTGSGNCLTATVEITP